MVATHGPYHSCPLLPLNKEEGIARLDLLDQVTVVGSAQLPNSSRACYEAKPAVQTRSAKSQEQLRTHGQGGEAHPAVQIVASWASSSRKARSSVTLNRKIIAEHQYSRCCDRSLATEVGCRGGDQQIVGEELSHAFQRSSTG